MKSEIWYENLFVKRTLFIILIFPKQTGLYSAVRVGKWIDWKTYDLKNFTCHEA